jgi:hypothetical protein
LYADETDWRNPHPVAQGLISAVAVLVVLWVADLLGFADVPASRYATFSIGFGLLAAVISWSKRRQRT